jgi:Cof subfamily protein (haloacid dehalogenase superfamily)
VSITGKRPKLIATDLDGTIVVHGEGYDNSQIRQRTVDAFKKAHELGIHIYFVTGRPPRWMPEIRDAFGFGNSICANGAMLYDFVNDEVLEEWGIPIENQKEIARVLREHIPNISFAIEYGDEFHHELAYVPRWDIGVDMQPIAKIEERMVRPAFKMLARCSDYDMTSDEMLEIAQREVGHLATITHSNPTESLLEISAIGVSKGETLAKIAERHGLTAEDCVSFGDNPNDFSMLAWAGRSWAMGDGHRDGIKYAKFVAEPHHTDSVARIIEELIELPA